ncbi:MAG: hypothetical protein IKW81_04350 [Pseudobutyrivibrio sp.]|nr:hypothetical protein [Pseudobutyrivibrio sp.]
MTQKRPVGGKGGMRSRNTASPTRQGVASKELQEARRRRRQKEVMRNRIIFGVACVAILALLILGIVKLGGALLGSGKAAASSTLTFEESGQVVFEEVADFDASTYSRSEFKSYTKDLIKEFNDSHGDGSIKLDRLRFKANQVYIKTTYKDADCYSAFTSYKTYNGSYEGAVSAGYDFATLFCTTEFDKKGEARTVSPEEDFSDLDVAVVSENVTVKVPGQIYYISDTSTDLVDANTVSIKQADGNDDATDLVYIVYWAGK